MRNENVYDNNPMVNGINIQPRSILPNSGLENSFPSLNRLMFLNPLDPKPAPDKHLDKNESMKIQMMEEKMRTYENKQGEEKSRLLDAINKNMLNSSYKKEPKPEMNEATTEVVSTLREEISKQFAEQSKQSRELMFNLETEFKNFRTDMNMALDTMQTKQKIYVESVRYIFEHSGSRRVKHLAQRVLSDGNYYMLFRYIWTA